MAEGWGGQQRRRGRGGRTGDLPEAVLPCHGHRMTDSPHPPRRAAVLTADRITMAAMATALGISPSTLRRKVRPTRDVETRALWAERLQLQQRRRGSRLPVYHARRDGFLAWAWELRGADPPVDT